MSTKFLRAYLYRWEEFLEFPRLEGRHSATENASGQLSSYSCQDLTGRSWLNETGGWWGRDKYVRWILFFNIFFFYQVEGWENIISLSSREQDSKKICNIIWNVNFQDSKWNLVWFFLVRYFYFKALCQSTQKTSFLLFRVPQRVFPFLLRWTCSPPPGSDDPTFALKFSPKPHSILECLPVCQTFSLL